VNLLQNNCRKPAQGLVQSFANGESLNEVLGKLSASAEKANQGSGKVSASAEQKNKALAYFR